MIIARIMGGPGNQLFSYAAARALALRAGTELLLDATTGYQDDGFGRSYQLDLFDLPVREATA
ncbi:MAG: hypothetical protein P1V51_08320 [Deltaproteobacteria bacterium]|nr:hypothetical protein [Deltaproteobacteria bacterium]